MLRTVTKRCHLGTAGPLLGHFYFYLIAREAGSVTAEWLNGVTPVPPTQRRPDSSRNSYHQIWPSARRCLGRPYGMLTSSVCTYSVRGEVWPKPKVLVSLLSRHRRTPSDAVSRVRGLWVLPLIATNTPVTWNHLLIILTNRRKSHQCHHYPIKSHQDPFMSRERPKCYV